MAYGTGTAEINFGAFPGSNEASVTVLVPTITATAKVESWVMADDSTTDHTAADHRYFPQFASLTCGSPVVSTGFTIYARSIHKLEGAYAVRYVWSD
jgi:hypothetical protein